MENNYEIYDKKILGVIRGLENWRHLLEGTKSRFEQTIRIWNIL